MSSPFSDARVLASWHANAAPWVGLVRRGEIESRRLVTNQAIVDAVLAHAPRTALDLGCGEGWLARALAERGVRTLGVDGVPALIAAAREAGGAEFQVATFDEIASGFGLEPVDAVVANFSLIGRDDVDAVVRRIPALLAPRGRFHIQTLHPHAARGDQPYTDGWRAGSWAGFSDPDLTDPAPWYFRTIGGWVRLLVASGLRIVAVAEPLHPVTGAPASLILSATSD